MKNNKDQSVKIKIKSENRIIELKSFPNQTSVWVEDRPIRKIICYNIEGKLYPKTDIEIIQ